MSIDATTGTEQLLQTLETQTSESSSRSVVNINGNLYFTVNDSQHGVELWKTDGTPAGTGIAKDFDPGPASGCNGEMELVGSGADQRIVLGGNNGTSGFEPYAYQPATDSITQLHNFPGTEDSNPIPIRTIDSTLYFTATDSSGTSNLYRTDGTSDSTALLKTGIVAASYSVVENGMLFFISGNELWRTDGTAGGTVRLAGLPGSTSHETVQWLATYAGKIYFNLFDYHYTVTQESVTNVYRIASAIATPELFFADGMSQVQMLFNADQSKAYFNTTYYLPLRTKWFALSADGNTVTLISYNNSPPPPSPTPQPQPHGSPFTNELTVNGKRYYAYDDGIHGSELWEDDHVHNPVMVSDLYPGAIGSSPEKLLLINGRLVFSAFTPVAGRELYALRLSVADRLPIITRPTQGLRVNESNVGGVFLMRKLASLVGIDELVLDERT